MPLPGATGVAETGALIVGGSTTPPSGDGDGGVKLPLSLQPIGGGIGMLVDADGDPVVGDDGMPILRNMDSPGTGGSAGRTIFPSEVEANQASAALARARAGAVETPEERAGRTRFDEEQAELNRQADIEAAALREEGSNRRQRLSTLSQLIGSFLDQQSQARDTLANLQPDPFRFAAVKGGILPFGTTPQGAFQQELQQFAGASVPQFDPSGSAASLDPIIAQLTGGQAPQAPQGFGMAKGGTVTPAAQPQSFLVGEKGPEVMTVTAQGVQVTPLAGGMAEGGAIGFNFDPIKFDKESLFPALQTSGIFGSLGINQLPITRRGPNNEIFGTGFPGTETFNKLGIRPRLVRDSMTRDVFLIENGQHRYIGAEEFASSGFNQSDIVNLSHEDVLSLAPQRGGNLPMDFRQQVSTDQPSPFTRPSVPIIEPTTGTVLPAPFMVAGQMNKLRLTDIDAFNLLLSAYKAAGVPATSVLSTIQQALPFGQARNTVGLN